MGEGSAESIGEDLRIWRQRQQARLTRQRNPIDVTSGVQQTCQTLISVRANDSLSWSAETVLLW